MLEEFRIKEANKQIEHETQNLEEIKHKMDLIKKSAHGLNVKQRSSLCHDQAVLR